LLAGVRDTVLAGYTRILTQRIGLSWTASYFRLSGRVGTIGTTENIQGAALMSIRIFRSFSFTAQGGLRYVEVPGTSRRREVFAGVGLAWMPGDDPFTL
jgi:hypothetical protein